MLSTQIDTTFLPSCGVAANFPMDNSRAYVPRNIRTVFDFKIVLLNVKKSKLSIRGKNRPGGGGGGGDGAVIK